MKKPTLAHTCARIAALFEASASLDGRANDHLTSGARLRARLCTRASRRLNLRALALLATVAEPREEHRGDFWAARMVLLSAQAKTFSRARVARSRLRAPATRAA